MKTKIVALKKNEDFKNLLKGRKLSNKYFVMFYKKIINKNYNNLNISIVTKKKLGNAVKRNFCKRRFKNLVNEAVKKTLLNFKYSYLILAKDNSLKKDSLDKIRSGNGPMFIEFKTYRWREHCGPNYDNNLGYRDESEFLRWKKNDPISNYTCCAKR